MCRNVEQVMRVVDLFCGGGGAAMGLHQAWPDAEIIGVDIVPQPRYPFTFVQADALIYPLDADFIWASPPCQAYTPLKATTTRTYPDLVGVTREMLIATGVPWVIENVPQAPLLSGIYLCGTMFDLRVYRHRHFEASWLLMQPPHPKHVVLATGTQRGRKKHYDAGGFITITGDVGTYCGGAMGIDWMNGNELSQAIPPAYARYVAGLAPV
jgi:DNA (cytosine-5)-methyltransferase 1